MQETETRNKKINALPEFFAVLALIGIHVAVIYRYGFSVPEQLEFYKWAEVNGDFAMPVLSHNAAYAMTGFLYFVFLFFGNKWVIAAVSQVILQILVSFLFFKAAGRLFGRAAAIISVFLIALLPEFLFRFQTITPALFIELGVAVCFCLYAELFSYKEKEKLLGKIILAVICGFFTGVAIWLDFSGILLVIAMVYGLMIIPEEYPIKKRSALAVSFVCGVILSVALLMFVEWYFLGQSFLQIGQEYIMPYMDGIQLVSYKENEYLCIRLIAGCVASLGVIVLGFWKHVFRRASFVAVILMGVCVLSAFSVTQLPLIGLELFLWILMAGALLQLVIDKYRKKPDINKVEEQVPMKENVNVEKPGFIPNPLPLPKKHVKKEINFDYEPTPEEMKYDYELKAGEEEYDI